MDSDNCICHYDVVMEMVVTDFIINFISTADFGIFTTLTSIVTIMLMVII